MAEIFTIRGMMDEAELTYHRIITDNDNEYTVREEWRDADGVEVKSNAHTTIKRGLFTIPQQGGVA
jgi:hypothetical protein